MFLPGVGVDGDVDGDLVSDQVQGQSGAVQDARQLQHSGGVARGFNIVHRGRLSFPTDTSF